MVICGYGRDFDVHACSWVVDERDCRYFNGSTGLASQGLTPLQCFDRFVPGGLPLGQIEKFLCAGQIGYFVDR
jgi:hypothetical protein